MWSNNRDTQKKEFSHFTNSRTFATLIFFYIKPIHIFTILSLETLVAVLSQQTDSCREDYQLGVKQKWKLGFGNVSQAVCCGLEACGWSLKSFLRHGEEKNQVLSFIQQQHLLFLALISIFVYQSVLQTFWCLFILCIHLTFMVLLDVLIILITILLVVLSPPTARRSSAVLSWG